MPAPPTRGTAALAAELLTALRFYTRLPLPPLGIEAAHPPEPFARCLAWAPLAGGVRAVAVPETARQATGLVAAGLSLNQTGGPNSLSSRSPIVSTRR